MKKSKKCIIYTRVNSKDKLLTNDSIECQTRYCEELAYKQGFTNIKYMGGICESAKGVNRKGYKEMLDFALDDRNGVETIFVYFLDRFSRDLASIFNDFEMLKNKNITLYPVQNPMNTNSNLSKYFINFKLKQLHAEK